MPATHLVWLDVWILCWLRGDAQRSHALLATSYATLLDGFALLEQPQMCARGKPAYLVLTPAGSQCVPHVSGLCDV
jgi:hypothetical protein